MAEQKPDDGLDVEETTDNPLASAAPAGDGSTRVVSNPISNVIDTSGGGAPAKSKVPLIAGAVAGVVVLIIIAVLAMGGDDAAEAPPLPPGRSAGTSTAALAASSSHASNSHSKASPFAPATRLGSGASYATAATGNPRP